MRRLLITCSRQARDCQAEGWLTEGFRLGWGWGASFSFFFFSCQLSPGSRDFFFFFPLPDNKDIIRSKMQWLRDGSGMVSSGSYVFLFSSRYSTLKGKAAAVLSPGSSFAPCP